MQTAESLVPGYNSVTLSSPVAVSAGTRFSVVVRAETPEDGYKFLAPLEYAMDGYADEAKAKNGEGWLSTDGDKFEDIIPIAEREKVRNASICLKAFGERIYAPVANTEVTVSGDAVSVSASVVAANDNEEIFGEDGLEKIVEKQGEIIDALKAAITDKTCAVLLEPVQGEGGILPADREYLRQVRALCDEKNLLLLFDEVQCGMGRIGTRFAWQSFGVEPDAFSMAKAIANGLPMGGFIVQRKYADTLTVGTHASTFGGTPLVSAAALAVQEAFDQDGVLENCVEQGNYLRAKLAELGKKYSFVKEVRGMGLMIGVVLDREAATLAGLLLKRNLVVLTAGETVLRLLPPLVITRQEADLGLEKIAAGLEELDRLIKEEK